MTKPEVYLMGLLGALSVALCAQNIRVSFMNDKLKSRLDAQMKFETTLNSPQIGQTITMLKGVDVDGQDLAIDLPASFPKITLLVCEPGDSEVEDNFAFWDKLLSDDDLDLIAVTTSVIPKDYVQRHPRLVGHHILRLNEKVAKDLHLEAAPQTIYLENGVVKRTWFGLLSDSDIKQIQVSLQRDWQWKQ